MSEPFLAEIRMFPGNFAPNGWAFCNGQTLPISQNQALFALLKTNYGGDGQANFALPDLQGRIPMHPGTGPGLTPRTLGEGGGTASVTLAPSELPAHTHPFARPATSDIATDKNPENNLHAQTDENQYCAAGTTAGMASTALSSAGGSQPHNNLQPFLVVNFIIALQGVYPQRWP